MSMSLNDDGRGAQVAGAIQKIKKNKWIMTCALTDSLFGVGVSNLPLTR